MLVCRYTHMHIHIHINIYNIYIYMHTLPHTHTYTHQHTIIHTDGTPMLPNGMKELFKTSLDDVLDIDYKATATKKEEDYPDLFDFLSDDENVEVYEYEME